MGLHSTFSCNEPFQDLVSVSQFYAHCTATRSGPRLRLLSLTQDGEPDSQVLSSGLHLQLLTAGAPIENRGEALTLLTSRCDLKGELHLLSRVGAFGSTELK